MRAKLEEHALVLRHVDYGESDVIVELLTRESGRVGLFARGARKSNRRFVGGLGPFTLLRVSFLPGKNDALGTLSGSEALEFFDGIVGDPLKLAAGAHFLSLLREALPGGTGADPAFSWVLDVFRWMARCPNDSALLAFGMLRAEIVLLQDAGLLAALDCCAATGVPIGELSRAIFVPGEGVFAADTSTLSWEGVALDRAALRLLEGVLERKLPDSTPPEAFHALRKALFLTWMATLERPPKTWAPWDEALNRALCRGKVDNS